MKTRNGALTMTHPEMAAALDADQAVPLAPGMPWTVRHANAWWIAYEGRWLRVTEASLAADLDQAAEHLHEAESVADRLNVLRQSLQILTDDQ